MSKGAIRLPASAISGGRVGTARVRETIAGAAARLASTEHAGLDGAIRALAGATPLLADRFAADLHAPGVPAAVRMAGDSRATHRALGRLGGGRMNKTETAYAEHLAACRHAGNVLWFRFEGIKLRLADRTFYTPDFAVLVASGALELHEVKGFMEEDAAVKLKSAAAQYPFVVRVIRRVKGGDWDIREV
jgi:hypothetical protein